MKAATGNRKPQECGIRICNQKYMFMTSGEKDGVKYCCLTRQGGGGATVCLTGKTLCVGVWDKNADQSDAKKQNTGNCQVQVQNVAASLNTAGY
jgi:hypothetical protein